MRKCIFWNIWHMREQKWTLNDNMTWIFFRNENCYKIHGENYLFKIYFQEANGEFCVHSLVSTMLGMFQNNMTKRVETLSKIKDAS
jgi:hypothetical protein